MALVSNTDCLPVTELPNSSTRCHVQNTSRKAAPAQKELPGLRSNRRLSVCVGGYQPALGTIISHEQGVREPNDIAADRWVPGAAGGRIAKVDLLPAAPDVFAKTFAAAVLGFV